MNKKRETINPDTIHDPPGFSHIVIPKGDKIVFIAGQTALDKDLNVVGENDLSKQTEQVYKNLQEALKEINADWDNVAKTTIYTTPLHDDHETTVKVIGEVTSKFFGDVALPAQTLVGVNALAYPELMVEIEATVVMDE